MAVNVDAMLRAAVEAYRAGNRADARALLDKVLEVDEYNEAAWMWMSAAVDTPEEQRTCLENVLVINPNNEKARMGMKALGIDPDAPDLAAARTATPPSFSEESFDTAPNQSSGSVWDDDEPPTATSSASSTSFRGATTSPSELDSWISGMGIGDSNKQSTLPPSPHPFTDVILGDDDDEEEFDAFDDRLNSMFSADEFDIDDSRPSKPAAPRAGASSPRSPASPAFAAPSYDFDEDDEDDSPFDEDISLTDISDDDLDEFEALIQEVSPARTQTGRAAPGRQSPAPSRTSFDDEEDGEGPDAAMLFAQIPREIEASSRLPGENEEAPRPLLMGIVVLVLLNLAVLGYILAG